MRIAIGADHAGFALKQKLGDYLQELGHAVIDLGTVNQDPVDYPTMQRLSVKLIEEAGGPRACSSVAAALAHPSPPTNCRAFARRCATIPTRLGKESSTMT